MIGEMWKNEPPFGLAMNKACPMMLLGIASITLDVERCRSRVWCSLGPGYGSACLEDGGIHRSSLSGFLENGAESKWRTVPSVSQR